MRKRALGTLNIFTYFCNIFYNRRMQHTYPDHFEEKIGFDRIRSLLAIKCLSTMGREWVENMHFQEQHEIIDNQLGETNEFLRIVREADGFPASHYYDMRDALMKIRVEGRFL